VAPRLRGAHAQAFVSIAREESGTKGSVNAAEYDFREPAVQRELEWLVPSEFSLATGSALNLMVVGTLQQIDLLLA
jgi:hypothetical protein